MHNHVIMIMRIGTNNTPRYKNGAKLFIAPLTSVNLNKLFINSGMIDYISVDNVPKIS